MSSSSTTPAGNQQLRQARATVLASLENGDAPQPQAVTSSTSLGPLPADVAAVLAERRRARLDPTGTDYPRRSMVARIGGPVAGLGALGVAILVIGLLAGDPILTTLGAVETILFGGGAVLLIRHARADPLRIDGDLRAKLTGANSWTPGRTAPDEQQALLGLATDAAQRAVDSRAWRSGVLDRLGVRMSLPTELDHVHDESLDPASRERAVTRTAAMVAYADAVLALPVTGEPDSADVEVLAFLLSGAVYEVA